MVLLREIHNESKTVELTKRPSSQEVSDAWPDHVTYRGASIFDQYYHRNERMVTRALERENNDIDGFEFQESYLGYSPKNDVFVAGYDTWGYQRDEDDDEQEVDEITNVMIFKMVPSDPNNLRVTTVNPYHTPGTMFYGRGGSHDRIHSQFKDLIDIRLD